LEFEMDELDKENTNNSICDWLIKWFLVFLLSLIVAMEIVG